ncbi:MAG: nucleoside-diphosphate sugar epimerase/dehydratase [Candidatus Obscuribacterales bacterium]|nr:nucleoside-diphosphate sugar epimerase/dehydratase [Candidatus Obscuribacterales bacterium]
MKSFESEDILQNIRWMRILQIVLDAALIALAILGAFLIRFDGRLVGPTQGFTYIHQMQWLLPVIIVMQLAANWKCGVYRRLWRYTGLTEMMELGLSVLSVAVILYIARAFDFLGIEGHQLSYGIVAIEAGLCFTFLAGPRVLRRLQTEHNQRRHWRQPVRRRALLVGAGDAGMLVLREMNQRSDIGVDIVGVLDDDPQKFKKRIGALTVFGTTEDLPRLVEDLFIDQVIIAIPSAPPAEIRRIVDMCRAAEVETRILPGLFELINGRVSVNQLREVSLEDLLGRDPVQLDTAAIASYIEGRCVLVTGAGGSIGSELCRQIMRFQPSKLMILGKGENSIFTIQQELHGRPEPVEIIPVIADIRDYQRLFNVFSKHRPQVVFHAAAHKHVPLMEANVVEAITNNVRGTQNVAELSAEFNVETFVLVSSDKAVNPTSVMGATKRIAELVVQELARRSKTKYVAVRFGNVLASRGSVIPLWRQQIAAGGPVTVTHKDATRYFMLIPEAVQLILQAGALGKGGEIFVLDMGKPVKIADLAHDLIKFSGLRVGTDIEIKYIGLRPGEKLYEELLTAEEGLTKTSYEKIFVGKPQVLEPQRLTEALAKLFKGANEDDEESIRIALDGLAGGSLVAEKTK